MHESLFNDKSDEKYLTDLLEVGPKKPLGYLPLDTIRYLCGVNPDKIAKYLEGRGIKTRKFKDSILRRFFGYNLFNVEGGALYAYDPKSLQQLLDKNSDTLHEADWPTQTHQFVVKVATTQAKSPSRLFDLIADAFADYDNRYRMNRRQ